MEEIILVAIGELKSDILIINFLKKKFIIKKIAPKNIVIYASSNKKTIKTSLIMRDVIKNRIIYYPVCIMNNFLRLLIEPPKINRGTIIIANLKQISYMINIIKENKKYNLMTPLEEVFLIQKRFTSR